MAQKLSIQIALEGGQVVVQQLEQIGRTGTKVFGDIQKAAGQVSGAVNLERAVQGINRVTDSVRQTHRTFVELGRVIDDIGLGPIGSLVSSLGRAERGLGALGAVVVAGGGLIMLAKNAAETAASLQQVVGLTGKTVQEVSALQQAYSAAGIGAQKFGELQNKLALGMEEARKAAKVELFGPPDKETVQWANDVGNLTRKFQDLQAGVQTTFSDFATTPKIVEGLFNALNKAKESGQNVDDVLANIVKTMTPLQRAQILPAAGFSLDQIKALERGPERLAQLRQEAQKGPLLLTPEEITNLERFNDAVQKSAAQVAAWAVKIGAAFAGGVAQLNPQGFIAGFINPIVEAFTNLWQIVQSGAGFAASAVSNFIASIGNIAWDAISNAGVAAWNAVTSAINDAIAAVLRFLGISQAAGGTPLAGGAPIGGAGGGIGSAAGGGLIGGRGTGTSDSNLAWLSRGEFVVPAAAVARPGVLAFLEALRHGINHFAFGGLVPRSIPVFAGGGLVGGMSNVTIYFPGVPPVSGLRASSAVVDELRHAAALAQVRSGGRKPSRYS